PRGRLPAHGDDASLAGGIGSGIEEMRRRRQGQDARHIQYRTTRTLLEELPNSRPIGEKHAFEIGVERRLPAVVGAFVKRAIAMFAATAAGDMEEDVEAAEFLNNVREQGFDLGCRCRVKADVQTDADDVGSFGAKTFGGGQANAGGAANDQATF